MERAVVVPATLFPRGCGAGRGKRVQEPSGPQVSLTRAEGDGRAGHPNGPVHDGISAAHAAATPAPPARSARTPARAS